MDLRPLMREFQPRLIHLQNVVTPEALRWASGERAVSTIQDHRLFCPGRGKWTATAVATQIRTPPMMPTGFVEWRLTQRLLELYEGL